MELISKIRNAITAILFTQSVKKGTTNLEVYFIWMIYLVILIGIKHGYYMKQFALIKKIKK